MPSGLGNAMGQTKAIRDWAKQHSGTGQFVGAGIGINIRKDAMGNFMLNASLGGMSRDDVFADEFEMLEAIQALIQERFK